MQLDGKSLVGCCEEHVSTNSADLRDEGHLPVPWTRVLDNSIADAVIEVAIREWNSSEVGFEEPEPRKCIDEPARFLRGAPDHGETITIWVQTFEEVVNRVIPMPGDAEVSYPRLSVWRKFQYESIEDPPTNPKGQVISDPVQSTKLGRVAKGHSALSPGMTVDAYQGDRRRAERFDSAGQ